MCSDTVISLKSASKVYETYKKPSHRLLQLFLKEKKLYDEFVALRDVNLEVFRGETVGIIGKNGSGKSTLLQLVAGTLYQSTGEVFRKGRIAAILELGAGFNPEFTGIENARLNASIMGMDRHEIEARLPDILEFSELGDFIYKPVKTYSSGMYVRLAFSVVINMQPDILIIDEALAVGDAGFQRKCFRKLDELKYNNVTILFVTHATDAIVAHCDRAVFLEKGGVKEIGKPKTVVNNYLESLFNGRYKTSKEAARAKEKFVVSKELNTDSRVDGCPYRASYNATEYRWGNGEGRIIDYTVLNKERGEIGAICKAGSDVTIAASVYFPGAQQNLVYGLTIKTVDGITVFGSNSMKIGFQAGIAEAGEVIRVEFGVGLQLISGEYFFSIGVVSVEKGSEDIILDRRYDLFRLHIEDDATAFGYAALPFSVNTKGKPAGVRC